MNVERIEAARMKKIPFSGIRKVFEKVRELEAQGENIIHFEIGRPDFDTPNHIKDAAKKALDNGEVHYTSNYGRQDLLNLISEKLKNKNGIEYDPKGEIVVTVGANEAVFMAMAGLLDPGDEILIPDPIWLHYFYCAEMAGGVPISIPYREENEFLPDPEEIESLITDKTKAIVINSPHNPTGSALDRGLIDKLAGLAVKHDLVVISDEIYEDIIFDGREHISIASAPGMRERTITISGFSKAYSMTGWRLGYVAAPSEIIGILNRVHQYTTVCACSFAQAGAVAALAEGDDCVVNMVKEFSRRRELVMEMLNDMPGIKCAPLSGAFYAFPSIKDTGMDSFQAVEYLLKEARIALVPGSVFGNYGEGYVRLSYANSYENLEEGLTRMKSALARL